VTERPPYVRQIAAELELLSHGATTSFGASSSGVPGSREPSGESEAAALAVPGRVGREGRFCAGALERDPKSRGRAAGRCGRQGVSEREIVLTDGEGFSADDVAMRYRLTATMVRRWRVEDKRDGETGCRLRRCVSGCGRCGMLGSRTGRSVRSWAGRSRRSSEWTRRRDEVQDHRG
jgi:hypothetical protein